MTRIPSSRKRSAVALPIPPDAPVTTAIFPLIELLPDMAAPLDNPVSIRNADYPCQSLDSQA
jgi:hypothetical protein